MNNCPRFRGLCYEVIRPFLCCLIFIAILYIPQNGNILTDGRNEKKYLRRKNNDL